MYRAFGDSYTQRHYERDKSSNAQRLIRAFATAIKALVIVVLRPLRRFRTQLAIRKQLGFTRSWAHFRSRVVYPIGSAKSKIHPIDSAPEPTPSAPHQIRSLKRPFKTKGGEGIPFTAICNGPQSVSAKKRPAPKPIGAKPEKTNASGDEGPNAADEDASESHERACACSEEVGTWLPGVRVAGVRPDHNRRATQGKKDRRSSRSRSRSLRGSLRGRHEADQPDKHADSISEQANHIRGAMEPPSTVYEILRKEDTDIVCPMCKTKVDTKVYILAPLQLCVECSWIFGQDDNKRSSSHDAGIGKLTRRRPCTVK